MDGSLRNSLIRLKEMHFIEPQVCRFPGKPVLLNQWIREKATHQGIVGDVASADMRELYRKVKQQEQRKAKITFDQRHEMPFLPLLLMNYRKEGASFYEWLLTDILKALDKNARRSTRRRTFQNLVFAYFKIYGDTKEEERTRKCIRFFLQNDPALLKLVLYLRNKKQLLQPNGHKQFTVMLQQFHGLQRALEEISWPPSLWDSPFIFQGIKELYRLPKVEWKTLYGVFQELCAAEKYRDLLPPVTTGMIYEVDRMKDGNIQKDLRVLLLKHLGDPRDPGNLFWPQVEERARNLFLDWLKKNDLNLFFTIISKTVQMDSTSERMWKYRKDFWEEYVDAMYYTRVFLGPDAAWIAKRENLESDFGRLSGSGDSLRSLLMFSIGDYVFIECSHNGSLRIWKKNKEPLPFYEKKHTYASHKYTDVTEASGVVERFVHNNADRGNWQNKVAGWIVQHCGIRIQRHMWGR